MTAPWLKPALLGIAAPVSLPLPGETGQFFNQVARHGEDAAQAFGCAVGAWTACRLAAATPPTIQTAETLPAPAGEDRHTLPAAHPWHDALASALINGPPRLQHEACLRLAALDATLPFQLLPVALRTGQRNQTLRDALLPVLGARGRWLAQFNSDWRYADTIHPEQDEDAFSRQQWDEGNHALRLKLFRRLRQHAPEQARQLLQEDLAELPAKERQELVDLMAHGLHADDETLLDALLSDRSREVRHSAARLLALLPESRHARRLTEWMATLVTSSKKLLRQQWRCDAPQGVSTDWATMGIDSRRPQHDELGERAWFLYQLARQVPLTWWQSHTGMSPKELIVWARKGDWSAALFRAWRERVGTNDEAWIDAMIDSPMAIYSHHKAALLALLPPAQRERHWPDTLDALAKAELLDTVSGACLPGETLSLDFSRPLLASIRHFVESDAIRDHHYLRAPMIELTMLVHPHCLEDWQPLRRRDDETAAMTDCITDLERIVALRRMLHRPLS